VRYQFVDCRFDLAEPARAREGYRAGHVPGASFLDLDDDLSDMRDAPARGRHPLPTAEAFAAAAGRAGIGTGVFVVAYDDAMTGGAARLWWLLRHFGHDDVAVVDGGLTAWRGPLEAGDADVPPATFEVRERAGDAMTADEIHARLGDARLAIVDARSAARYAGDPSDEAIANLDPIGGHIPGAVNVPFAGDRRFDPAVLEADEIVVYCGSGVTACVDLLALHAAGRTDARLYPGSWSEWSRRGLPVATGND
jgi:thiosulfate/3-mercaptopyruvate sulfurtransferase